MGNPNLRWHVLLIHAGPRFQRKSQAVEGFRRRVAYFHPGPFRKFDPLQAQSFLRLTAGRPCNDPDALPYRADRRIMLEHGSNTVWRDRCQLRTVSSERDGNQPATRVMSIAGIQRPGGRAVPLQLASDTGQYGSSSLLLSAPLASGMLPLGKPEGHQTDYCVDHTAPATTMSSSMKGLRSTSVPVATLAGRLLHAIAPLDLEEDRRQRIPPPPLPVGQNTSRSCVPHSAAREPVGDATGGLVLRENG